LLCLRNARAFPLLPAALASVPFGFVLVRVRVRCAQVKIVNRKCVEARKFGPPLSKVEAVHEINVGPALSPFCVCFCGSVKSDIITLATNY
jgi:hypothetical protein